MTDTTAPGSAAAPQRPATTELGPTPAQRFTNRVLPFIVGAAVVAAIPFMDPSRTAYTLLNIIGINIVFALSYNMLLGYAGLLSFGHAVYFGLGGYAVMHTMGAIENEWGLFAYFPPFFLPVIGFLGGAFAGAVIGWPSCRRSGIPFAMISLGIAQLIFFAGLIFVSVFGGEEGISGDRTYGPEFLGIFLGPINEVYIFIAFWTVVGSALIFAFTRTPLGRMSEAVRDNPERVEFVGYDPQTIRYMVFIASGGFAGLAGGMAAVNFEIFTPEALSLIPSGIVLLMAYIGGIRYFAGPILGAILLTLGQSSLSDFSEAWLLYLGILFIAVVMYAPSGLAGMIVAFARGATSPGAFGRLARWAAMSGGAALMLAGTIVLVEVLIRRSNGFGEVFEPYGYPLPHDSVMTWVIAIVPLAAGFAIIRALAPKDDA